MERNYEGERLVENSTFSMLQAMADEQPLEFLKLLDNSKKGTSLDEETTERFKRLGLLDSTGNVQGIVSEALRRVHIKE